MKRLLCYLKEYRKESILGPFFKLLEASFELTVPLVIAAMIDIGIPNQDSAFLVKMTLLLVALGLIGLICAVSAQLFAAKAAVGFAANVRAALFNKIQQFTYEQLDKCGVSTLITRMTGDIERVQTGVNLVLRLLLRSPFIVFGSMIMAFYVDSRAALIFVLVIPILAIVVFAVLLAGIPLYKKVQAAADSVLLKTRENLSGVRIIRAFRHEKAEIEAYREDTERLKKLQLTAGRVGAIMNPLTYVIVNLAILLLLKVGGERVNFGQLSQGDVVALLNYMSQILVELIKMANLIITVVRAAASADRIAEILDNTAPESGSEEIEMTDIDTVSFSNVAYAYPDAETPVVENITFGIKKGQTLGIIGGTGCGKSTIASLMAGFLEPKSGEILMNGQSILQIQSKSLRAHIGIVPQKAVLFSGTIRENLLWGRSDATEEELWGALRTAQADEFVRQKEGGLDAPVLQGGKNFSGGQRQRLTIARALVQKPSLLILDDSASALDYLTDAALRRALKEQAADMITVIISQRTTAVMDADCIIVMEDGSVSGIGTHDELLAGNEVYEEIYASQFPKEAAHV